MTNKSNQPIIDSLLGELGNTMAEAEPPPGIGDGPRRDIREGAGGGAPQAPDGTRDKGLPGRLGGVGRRFGVALRRGTPDEAEYDRERRQSRDENFLGFDEWQRLHRRGPYADLPEARSAKKEKEVEPQVEALAARTPSIEEIYDLVNNLGRVQGSSEVYSAEELIEIIRGVLAGERRIGGVTRTYGLKKIVQSRRALNALKRGGEVPPGGALPEPLGIGELMGLVGHLRYDVLGEDGRFHNAESLARMITSLYKGDEGRDITDVPTACGLRALTTGVLQELQQESS